MITGQGDVGAESSPTKGLTREGLEQRPEDPSAPRLRVARSPGGPGSWMDALGFTDDTTAASHRDPTGQTYSPPLSPSLSAGAPAALPDPPASSTPPPAFPPKQPALDVSASASSRMRQAALAAAKYKQAAAVALNSLPHQVPSQASDISLDGRIREAETMSPSGGTDGPPLSCTLLHSDIPAGSLAEVPQPERVSPPEAPLGPTMRAGAAEVVIASGDVYGGRRSRALSKEEADILMICPP